MGIIDLSQIRRDGARLKRNEKLEAQKRKSREEALLYASAATISIFTRNITIYLETNIFNDERFNHQVAACNFILQELAKAYGWKVDSGQIPVIYEGTITKPESGLPTYTFAVGGVYEEEILNLIAKHNPELKVPEFQDTPPETPPESA